MSLRRARRETSPTDITFFDMLRAWKQIEPPDELCALIADNVPGARRVMDVAYVLLSYWNGEKDGMAWPSLTRLRRKHSWGKNGTYAAIALATQIKAPTLPLLTQRHRKGCTAAYSFPAIDALAHVLADTPIPQSAAEIKKRTKVPWHFTAEQIEKRGCRAREQLDAFKREHGITCLGDLIGHEITTLRDRDKKEALDERDDREH